MTWRSITASDIRLRSRQKMSERKQKPPRELQWLGPIMQKSRGATVTARKDSGPPAPRRSSTGPAFTTQLLQSHAAFTVAVVDNTAEAVRAAARQR